MAGLVATGLGGNVVAHLQELSPPRRDEAQAVDQRRTMTAWRLPGKSDRGSGCFQELVHVLAR